MPPKTSGKAAKKSGKAQKAITKGDKKKGKKEVPEKKPPTSGVQAKVAVAQRAEDGANVAGTKRGP